MVKKSPHELNLKELRKLAKLRMNVFVFPLIK